MYSLRRGTLALRLRPANVRVLLPAARSYSTRNGDPERDEDKGVAKKEDFSIAQQTSKSAPAPMADTGIEKLLKKDNKPYVFKLKHERLTYDYPGLPNHDELGMKKQKVVTRWTRHLPKILTAIVVVWGAYAVKVWFFQPEEGAESKELLDPHQFHKFVVTHKQDIDEDHFLIEVKPKYKSWQYSYQIDKKSIWNGDKLWSVDIKQPQIMVVRSYTPLPLYFMKSERTRSGEKEPLLKVIDNDAEDYDKGGVMTFYIKKYKDGEVSRYISSRNVGDELELRGPKIEYTFPYHPLKSYHERPRFRDLPSKVEAESHVAALQKRNRIPNYDNLTFYAAGTGIAPALQLLFSRNPYRGFVTLHYSAQKEGEIKPFERFLFFLTKLDRLDLREHYDNKKRLSLKDVEWPSAPNYVSGQRLELESAKDKLALRKAIIDEPTTSAAVIESDRTWYENALEEARVTSREKKQSPALALVCGPDAYISTIAGPKLLETDEQGDVKGFLAEKGWTLSNVYKL